MFNRQTLPSRARVREAIRRLDRVAGDLNVLLVVIALGLATLDFTFLITQKVVDHLPPVTHISAETPAAAPSGPR
jgi:hypothetical protein